MSNHEDLAPAIGLDVGSLATKGVLLLPDGKIAARRVVPTGWRPGETAQQVLRELLARAPQEVKRPPVVTGYGKQVVPFRAAQANEIGCHAAGAKHLWPEVRTVIDIGGQDCKIISLDREGRVENFVMNDKCAAGTGRFLEQLATALEVDVPGLDQLAAAAGQPVELGNLCAVFAETEVVGLLSTGTPREDVAAGILHALVERLLALAGRVPLVPPVGLTGGGGLLPTVARLLAAQIEGPLLTTPDAQLVGALGAALKGAARPSS